MASVGLVLVAKRAFSSHTKGSMLQGLKLNHRAIILNIRVYRTLKTDDSLAINLNYYHLVLVVSLWSGKQGDKVGFLVRYG